MSAQALQKGFLRVAASKRKNKKTENKHDSLPSDPESIPLPDKNVKSVLNKMKWESKVK
jgi:hypothetical protein